ncbi:BTB/POZ domain-containing protein [Quillaja saponaria]|uniref:BTB/POZ domain-containing protein n=1 Tax=Quillaja saponaria TaxID=32244 RepID=A0AAD7PS51_QUISA|nr:BTB/POZ domain-containing protein [Quillaja saponaria]
MQCLSCQEDYDSDYAGTCKECYEEANETEEELKREIEDLKAKVDFLRFKSPHDHHNRSNGPCFTDIVLVASEGGFGGGPSVPVPAHKAVLVSRSLVFKAMLENEMEESRSGTIKISDVSFDALRAFVKYLYTAEANLDEVLACDVLILAEKYQVKHLKTYCEKFLVSRLNWENSVVYYDFAHQHNAKHILDSALSLITDNMDKVTKRVEYTELVEKDPRMVVEIYEAYLAKQVNTAAQKESSIKQCRLVATLLCQYKLQGFFILNP